MTRALQKTRRDRAKLGKLTKAQARELARLKDENARLRSVVFTMEAAVSNARAVLTLLFDGKTLNPDLLEELTRWVQGGFRDADYPMIPIATAQAMRQLDATAQVWVAAMTPEAP